MKRILFFMTLVLVALQGWATEVNPASLQFSTDVGQTVTQTISIKFADAEIPPDPNTPVVMSPSYGAPLQSIGQASGDYSVSIQGAGSQMFSAEITMRSFTSNACTVKVSYDPTAEGTHQATLNVNCSSAGVPTVSVNLTGSTTSASDDPITNLPTGLGSVTKGNGTGLPDGFILPGFNPDNLSCIDPVWIYKLIEYLMTHPDEVQFWIERIVDIIEIMSDFETWSLNIPRQYYSDPYHVLLPDFIDLPVGSNKKLPVEIVGYIQSPLQLQLDDNVNFSLSKQTIQPAEALFGTTIYIDYHPQSPGQHSTHIKSTTALWHVQEIGVFGTAIERTISVDPENLNFEPVYKDDVKTKKITVKGTHLTGDLMVTPSTFSHFTISPTTITAAQAQSANGAEVTVTYNPTIIGSHSAIFTISGGGALPETFSVSGSCELPPSPTITVDQTPLNFGTVNLGDDPKTKAITVKGTNLASDLNLSISGASGSMFTALPYRISPADAAAGRPVVVTYKPTAVGTHTATLVITGGGVDPVEISLSGKCLPVLEPSIAVDPSTYDFGTVNAETTNTAIFTVTGTGLNERISIIWPQEDGFTISPADLPPTGGKVTVTFKPTYEGRYSQEFTLSSGNVSAKINVIGESVIPPTIKTNVATLDFGTIVKGNQLKKHFTVTGINLTGDLTLSVSKPCFTVSPATITAADAAAGKEVTVIYKPTAGGNHNATLTISGGGAPDKIISLTGKCSAIDIAPSSSHNFGTVKEGSTNTAIFTVTGTNISERISLIWLQEDGFTITPADLPASGGKVTVTFKPTSGGNYSQEYNLSSGNTSAKITVTGKCAAITTSKSSLDFETVVIGKKKTNSFTVKGVNLTGDITLSSSSSMFKVNPDRITASEAAAGKVVTVTYEPTVKGSHSATITISGGSAKTKLVQLTGKCVVPAITTSESSLAFAGYYETRTFKVTGTDLTGNLTLTCNNAIFSVSPSTITVAEAKAGKSVLVLCDAPLNITNATGKITISGGGASPKYVNLTLDATGPQPYAPLVEPEDEGDDGNDGFSNVSLQEAFGGPTSDVNELSMASNVYAEGLNIIIETPMEQKALISDIAGHVREVELQAGRNEVTVNSSGIYFVRIREKSTKLMLK